ncbi:hypothetical protein PhCBS80983_g06098 [Powellomyces hirtus]|uniref:DDHD domain-containing protein n=1 Tax=Powellomyces hirtus TaxID=109895 RepID=A0A507DQZ5_9FUNG|nr:hypothetical protein PhCBS80983_g06098 [Powellomyces hirtus]
MGTAGAGTPDLLVRWFHAVDIPKQDDTPFRIATTTNSSKIPATWKPFSGRDSANLEAAYQMLQQKKNGKQKESATPAVAAPPSHEGSVTYTKVPVNEDQLFEADVEKMETYPVYWHGPTYDIRRGTWFHAAFGGSYLPCDENLSRQLEDGYKKFQPWHSTSAQSTPGTSTSVSSSTPVTSMPGGPPAKAPQSQHEQRWALFGPYMNQYVIYEGAHTAIQHSDDFGSKIGRAVMNIGGTRLTRGWDEVEKLRSKTKAQVAKEKDRENMKAKDQAKGKGLETAPSPAVSKPAVETDPAQKLGNGLSSIIPDITSSTGTITSEQAQKLQEKTETEDYDGEEDGDRPINHLVLVIHGIGQKLGERVEAVNFIHDCNILRRTIKDSSQQYATAKDQLKFSKRAGLINMPDDGGVQILPVQWRQKIQFGMARRPKPAAGDTDNQEPDPADLETTLDDITLDGVPSIRQLVSDVVLDVLLYMSPRYRQEMIKHVTAELNRIYRLFMQRNPKFNGKVSILGHSLGSLLAFDILCNQPGKPGEKPTVEPATLPSPSSKRPQEVDLTDLLHGATSADDRKVNGIMERSSIKYGDLDFDVDRLFVVGSPVGLFLLLKGDKIAARKPGMPVHTQEEDGISSPAVNAFYNIFHPHDPVAYRVEPMIEKPFGEQKPVPIPYTKGGLKGTIVGIQDLGSGIADKGRSMFEAAKLGITSTKAVVTSGISTSMGRMVTMVSSINAFKAAGANGSGELADEKGQSAIDTASSPAGVHLSNQGGVIESAAIPTHEPSVEMREIVRPSREGATDVELLNPRGRIDYVLQEGVLENPYISALGVHMNYWSDPDCALFMLRELYCEISGDDRKASGTGGPGGGGGGGPGGSDGGSGGSSGRDRKPHSGTEPDDRSTPRRGTSTGPPSSDKARSGGLGALVRDTTHRLSQMSPEDIAVFQSGFGVDMTLPFDWSQGNASFDVYALLHIVVSLITNLVLTGIRIASLLVVPLYGSRPP